VSISRGQCLLDRGHGGPHEYVLPLDPAAVDLVERVTGEFPEGGVIR